MVSSITSTSPSTAAKPALQNLVEALSTAKQLMLDTMRMK